MTMQSNVWRPGPVFPDAIRQLVARFEASKTQSPETRYGYRSVEAQLRNDFLDTFFETLGWDMRNQRSNPREVLVEQDIPESREKVDYSFRIAGQPKFFVEAKRAEAGDLQARDVVNQITEYSKKSHVRIVILTNFEHFVVYGWCSRPSRKGPPRFREVGRITCGEYEHWWGKIDGMFSRQAVEQGRLDEIVAWIEQFDGNVNLFSDQQAGPRLIPAHVGSAQSLAQDSDQAVSPAPPNQRARLWLGAFVAIVAVAISVVVPWSTRNGESVKAPSQLPRSGDVNDGADAHHPVLPAQDEGFVDARGGWGWGDRCYNQIKVGKLGWAKAECRKGMALANPNAQQPRASLLYNLGSIEQRSGEFDAARRYYEQSLALREHPEVRAALNSLP